MRQHKAEGAKLAEQVRRKVERERRAEVEEKEREAMKLQVELSKMRRLQQAAFVSEVDASGKVVERVTDHRGRALVFSAGVAEAARAARRPSMSSGGPRR